MAVARPIGSQYNEEDTMHPRAREIILRPGEIVPDSGIYEDINTGIRATLVKGEHAPPTREGESTWKQVIDTNPDN
jgi:hypothetical protein